MRHLISAFLLFTFTITAQAQHHPVPHNMIVYGEQEIFLSHIVYLEPHNYQVILKVNLDPQTLKNYLASRRDHPEDLHLLLLDDMHIGDIAKAMQLKGTLSRQTTGKPAVIANRVTLDRNDFSIVYFNELPLSLEVPKH